MSVDLLLIELSAYMAEGGFVMPPLIICTFVLWYGLGDRALFLRRGFRGDFGLRISQGSVPKRGVLGQAWASVKKVEDRTLDEADQSAAFYEALYPLKRSLNRNRVLVKSIVIIAPLAGLLGTVSGMIETFDSLGNQALFAASGGVAGGISQALLTTQMGLVVAIPGVIVGRLLDRKQFQLENDLDQLVSVACLNRGGH